MHRNPVPILQTASEWSHSADGKNLCRIERKGTKGKKNRTGRQGAVWSSCALCKCRYSPSFSSEYLYPPIVLFQR